MSPPNQQTLSHIIVNLNQTTSRLAHEKTQLESLLDNIAEGVVATDAQGKILRFNPTATQLTDIPEVQALGKSCNQILQLSEGQKSLKFKSYCPTRKNKPRNYQNKNLHILSKLHRLTPVALSSTPIMDLQGHTGWVITLRDLTAEQELEQMKQDFVSIAAHQLRTPLTTILGYLEAIQEEKLSSAQKTFVDQIDFSAHQLRDLVENLLNVTRIERGTIQTNFQPTDYLKLVKQTIKDLSPHIQAKHQKVKVKLPTKLPNVTLDPLHIRQVLVNLLTNAIQYTPAKGTITVKVEKNQNHITTYVIDTGPGIPKSAQKHLFQKFYRAPLPDRPSQSTGLGLYLAKELINLHHGEISVKSEVGKGSTFSFTLPLKQPK